MQVEGLVLAMFVLAVLAASFGWIGLAVYFAVGTLGYVAVFAYPAQRATEKLKHDLRKNRHPCPGS